jgi:putative membrane protein insertion efficiency factor
LPTEKVPSWELNRMMEPKPMSAWVARVPRASGRALIKAYRYTLSPLIGFHCRHLPTCSEYADQALQRYGLWAGGWMTLARLLRCHPWGGTGFDPVPEPGAKPDTLSANADER